MKIKFLSLVLFLTVGALAESKGGGGGDFHYMRSMEALGKTEFNKILRHQGQDFMTTVIVPSSWISFQYNINSEPSGVRNIILAPEIKKVWDAFGIKRYDLLWEKIKNTKLENCSCADVQEQESKDNQICAKSSSGEQKICLDMQKISDPNEKLHVDYHSLIGGIWHELAHLYTNGLTHEEIYNFGNKIKNQSILGGLKQSQRGAIEAGSTEVDSRKCRIGKSSFEVKSLLECFDLAAGFGKTSKVKIQYGNDAFWFDGSLKTKDYVPGEIFSCDMYSERVEFFESLLTERVKSQYDYTFRLKDKRYDFSGISYDIRNTDDNGKYLSINVPMQDLRSCFEAINHGFDIVQAVGQNGKYLRIVNFFAE